MKNIAHRLKGSSTSSCYKQNGNNEIVKKKVAAYVLESTETVEKVIFRRSQCISPIKKI